MFGCRGVRQPASHYSLLVVNCQDFLELTPVSFLLHGMGR